MQQQPKLRDSRNLISELYAINNIPTEIINKVGADIVYMLYTGRHDLTGNDWGNIFARAVEGCHFASPVGIVDVAKDKTAWSMKTIKVNNPFGLKKARLISGRCSPDYSFGIEDPHDDIQRTGEAVLSIWNSRVDIALSHYPRVRVNVLIRNEELTKFTLFEEYLEHFNLSDFEWAENSNSNFEGINKYTGRKQFVWQPHGSQFTILSPVPDDALKFKVRKPELLPQDDALKSIGFDSSWIEIL